MVFRSRLPRRRFLQGSVAAAWAVAFLPSATRSTRAQGTPGSAPTSALGWSDDLEDNNGKLNVATTVAPISSIVRNVGGTLIDLRGIVPDGTNSHTFEPAPSDATILARADLVIVNGLALETPTIDLRDRAVGYLCDVSDADDGGDRSEERDG